MNSYCTHSPPRYAARPRQRGAVLMMTASFLLLGVMSLAMVVDTGRLYVIKRNLQRVVDNAAIEVAARGGRCNDGSAQTIAQESLARNGFTLDSEHRLALPRCGTLIIENNLRQLDEDSNSSAATALRVEQDTPASLIAGGIMGHDITLAATATAAASGGPLAMLTLRSTLLNVNITQNSKAQLLSDIFGGLLGGSLNIKVGAWNGLIHTDIDLFEFMDTLMVNLSLEAGNYDGLMTLNVSTGELIQAAIDVLETQNGVPNTTIRALDSIVALDAILLATSTSSNQLKLGDILSLSPDADYDGAQAKVQLYQFVQAVILLANQNNAINAIIPINVLGNSIDLAIKVIEPPQFAAIGNPEEARAEAHLAINDSPHRIYVRSAQLRLALSVTLSSSLSALVSGLTSAVNSLTGSLTDVLNSLLSLNLGSLLIGTYDQLDILILPSPIRFDINLDLAGGNARVSDYTCQGSSRSLTVPTETAAATLRIGKMGSSAAAARANIFASTSAPVVEPIALLDLGLRECTRTLIFTSCDPRLPFAAGGLGLMAETPVLGSAATLLFQAPDDEDLPELGTQGEFQSVSSSQLINSLTSTLAGPSISAYESNGNGIGSVLMLLGSTINSVVALLQTAVSSLLSPLLDPIVTLLLNNLGLDLANTEVSANLSCDANQGVSLVR